MKDTKETENIKQFDKILVQNEYMLVLSSRLLL